MRTATRALLTGQNVLRSKCSSAGETDFCWIFGARTPGAPHAHKGRGWRVWWWLLVVGLVLEDTDEPVAGAIHRGHFAPRGECGVSAGGI